MSRNGQGQGGPSPSGSRFSVLEEQGEESAMEGVNEAQMDHPETRTTELSNNEEGSGQDGAAETTLDDEGMGIEEIILNVSQEELTKSLRSLFRKGHKDRVKVVGPKAEPKRSKDRPLKDLTNKLVVPPVNLKKTLIGPRQGAEKPNRGYVLSASSNRSEPAHEAGQFRFPPDPSVKPGKAAQVGSQEPRPPEPTQLAGDFKSSPNPKPPNPPQFPISFAGYGERQTEPKEIEEEVFMQKEQWSDCQTEEEMEITTQTSL